MKNFGIYLTALALTVAMSSSLTAAVPATVPAVDGKSTMNVVKAKLIDGEMMPVVDLPEVEITASRFAGNLVQGYMKGTEPVAVINLPQVEISAEGKNRTSGDVIGDNSLPVIEIVASFPLSELKEGQIYAGEPVATVNLPEVIIDGGQENTLLALSSPGFSLNEMRAALNSAINIEEELKTTISKLPESVYILAENCSRKSEEKLICDVSVVVGPRTDRLIQENHIIRMMIHRN